MSEKLKTALVVIVFAIAPTALMLGGAAIATWSTVCK